MIFKNLPRQGLGALVISQFFFSDVTCGFDIERRDNVVVYWGQASAGKQLSLKEYCDRPNIDVVIISFISSLLSPEMIPLLSQASGSCSTGPYGQLICPETAQDIEFCRSQGKKVLVSIGGAAGSYNLNSEEEAIKTASMVWDTYLGGDGSAPRPFGDVELDGVDLDLEIPNIEQPPLWMVFIETLREFYETRTGREGKSDYLLTGSPQCVYPDVPLSIALQPRRAWFDMLFIQFYNNFCAPINGKNFNFNVWADWARKDSLNPRVKLFLGAPAAPSAAASGWMPKEDLMAVAQQAMRENEPNNNNPRGQFNYSYNPFGGMSFWDVSWTEPDFTEYIKTELTTGYDMLEKLKLRDVTVRNASRTIEHPGNHSAGNDDDIVDDENRSAKRDASGSLSGVRKFFSHGRLHRRHNRKAQF